jgi:hypothetical protein
MKLETGAGAPMPKQTRLDVLGSQRLVQQRIIQKIDLADGQIVRRAPIGIEATQVLLFEDVLSSSIEYCILNGDTHRAPSP